MTALFVGGPRHGKVVPDTPENERDRYRVPALSAKDPAVEYVATQVILTFPDVRTGEPTGETYAAWLYVTPDLYPDNEQAGANLSAAWSEAACRQYLYHNGTRTRGGVEAVVTRNVAYVAWCEPCGATPETATEYPDLKTRAGFIANHTALTGHKVSWDNRKD